MSRLNILVAATAAVWLFTACSGTDEDAEPEGTTHTGITDCGNFPDGPKQCQAGQYCSDEGFSECSNGCLSNNNCASDQTCQKPGSEDVGICENNVTGPVSSCGNGVCEAGESSTTCAPDCQATAVCGNGVCEVGENSSSCAVDCQTSTCGNGVCDSGETETSCPVDCTNKVSECKQECEDYDFFQCLGPGELQQCYDACESASDAGITQFLNCTLSSFCNQSTCLPHLQ